MRVAVAIVPRLLMTVVAAGRNKLIQNGGQVMLQSWLELNRTDRPRAPDDAQHRYGCSMPSALASGDDNTVTTVVTLS